jgi:hypothetical protein
MFVRPLTFILGISLLCGCSGGPELLGEPVEVNGTVKRSSGEKVGDVSIKLEPLDTGFPSVLEVVDSNRVSGKAVPGKYSYFVIANSSKNSSKSLATYPESMLAGSMTRVVTIAPGKEIDVVLE